MKRLFLLILLFLLYKYYTNDSLKKNILSSIEKIDKVPIKRTYNNINEMIKKVEKKNMEIDENMEYDYNIIKGEDLKNKKMNKEVKNKIKRNVSSEKKKYVASKQGWRCGHCRELLDASYEIDHIVALYKGGGNEINNLVALCRNCHGKKTIKEKLDLI